jgi:hypothetical protein
VGFVVDKVVLKQVILQLLHFLSFSVIALIKKKKKNLSNLERHYRTNIKRNDCEHDLYTI